MDVRIGVLHCPKELTIEVDGDAGELEKSVNETLRSERAVLWLTDVDGRRVGVPAERVAYVEIELNGGTKRVGFGPGG
jgi:hypothetical protein